MTHRRRGACPPLPGYPQLPLQARAPAGAALHLPRQARLGPVLLQDGAQGGPHRAGPQEPAGLHRHEPHRPQPGARYSGGELKFNRETETFLLKV